MFMKITATLLLFAATSVATAAPKESKQEFLVKLAEGTASVSAFSVLTTASVGQIETVNDEWVKVTATKAQANRLMALKENPVIEFIQPNYAIRLMEDYTLEDPLRRAAIARLAAREPKKMPPDNPAFPAIPVSRQGDDPLFSKQWGMNDIGVKDAWRTNKGSADMIVAVIDTGVDYTHEDLVPNLWRNPGETGLDAQGRDKSSNGIDDDGNGYVDDVLGWDFVTNDNKPFDLAVEPLDLLKGAGNPGHGTHCAGNVAARGDNAIGVAGVAPNVKIMSLRFLSEKGGGTTADAIKAIDYAVKNGAKVLSNSWGSEGEDPSNGAENKALRDSIQNAMNQGVLFIAAAGNGHRGVGYDNDTDKMPAYPASYDHDNIISVAALDVKDQLGSFSNWGARSVDIGAPGVIVFSTTVGGQYSDVVIDKFGFYVTWDGTSMATPHVAGAAALYWSQNPTKTWREVKAAIMGSVKKIPSVANKTVSGGKLDVKALMGMP